MGQHSQYLTELLPTKIRSAGDAGGKTTALDHRQYETAVIEAIAFLEAMFRGNTIFADELNDLAPQREDDVQQSDLFLDTTGKLMLWRRNDGQWQGLGKLVGEDGAKILGGVGVPDPNTGRIGDWYFRYNAAAYEKTPGGWENRFALGAGASLPNQSGQNGKVLSTDGTAPVWIDAPNGLPNQAGKNGRFLQSDGTTASWVQGYSPAFSALAFNAALTWNTNSKLVDNRTITLTANVTSFVMSNVVSGFLGVLKVYQDGTGGRTLVLPGASRPTSVILNGTPNSLTELSVQWDGVEYTWHAKYF